ncbi:MAG: hypothetical protein WCQ99_03110 [Pseudomonadota bacterium]
MQRIPIEKAVRGMVTAKSVLNETGVVLIGQGTELTDGLIEKLKSLDIQNVIVKGRPLDLGVEEKGLEQLYKELEDRFGLVASDKLCTQIKELIKKDLKHRKEETT